MGVAPAQFASWIAASPTLLDAARMITKSPTVACVISRMASAVKYCIQIDAASIELRPGGAAITLRAGTMALSAYTPYSPSRYVGSTHTRSPGLEVRHAVAE